MTQEEKDRLQYMIDVMQAYLDGKEIEYMSTFSKWFVTSSPIWDWADHDYRVKPEPPKPKYRPFESAEEVMQAIKEHGGFIKIKSTDAYMSIRAFDNEYVWVNKAGVSDSFTSAVINYTFADGTPFGKLIEE